MTTPTDPTTPQPKPADAAGLRWDNCAKALPSRDFLMECFRYLPESGELFWKHRPQYHFETQRGMRAFNTQNADTMAGVKHFRRGGKPTAVVVRLTIGGIKRCLYVHRIAFKIMNGTEEPKGMVIDHEDGNPFNNKWDNFRLLTHQENIREGKRLKALQTP